MKHSAIATVILAHGDAPQVQRALRAMKGTARVLHCDARTAEPVFRAMISGLEDDLCVIRRVPTTRTSWSLVHAELDALRAALRHTRADHIVVMSGACYPVTSVQDLEDELAGWRGLTRMWHFPLPHPRWDTARNPDGGLWRFRRRFVLRGEQVMHVGGHPLRGPRREIPSSLELHGGSQWKIYARSHVEAVLELLDRSPDLIRFFRHSYVPDESFFPTLLRSRQLLGQQVADETIDDRAWYWEWPQASESPMWLTNDSFGRIRARATGPVRSVGDPPAAPYRCLFVRKVASAHGDLVERIDLELRS